MTPTPTLAQRMTVFRLIHAALLMSLAAYAFVARTAVPRGGPPQPLDAVIVYAVAGVALLELCALPILRRALMPPMTPASSLSDEVSTDAPGAVAAIAKLFTVNVITWALCESICILGLALAFMSHDTRYFSPFAIVSALALIAYRPSEAQLRAAVRAST